jgi:ankyrin repeat protein
MPDKFQCLIEAILDDDRQRAKELLRQDKSLANATAREASLERKLPHWIYAGDSALHAAAAGYRVEIAKLLLDTGADCCAARNHRRSQPLHYAADGNPGRESWDANRQLSMMEILLNGGADIHARDKNGATPLHRAVRTRCAKAVKFLLAAGADATLKNKPGSTPFHLAVQNTGRGGSGAEEAKAAQREIIEAFLERGISPKLKDLNGKSVLEWARNDSIRQILTAGPKRNDKT